jgi:hypothetical protein
MNASLAYETKVMKDIEGWVPGESVTKYRWLPPAQSLQELIEEDVDF